MAVKELIFSMTAYDDDDGGLGKVEDEVDRQIARKVSYAAH